MSKKQHDVTEELLESLLSNYQKPEDLLGDSGLLKQLTKRLVEKALEAEMSEHLGHDRHEPIQNDEGNARNGKSKKTLKGGVRRATHRDPQGPSGDFRAEADS